MTIIRGQYMNRIQGYVKLKVFIGRCRPCDYFGAPLTDTDTYFELAVSELITGLIPGTTSHSCAKPVRYDGSVSPHGFGTVWFKKSSARWRCSRDDYQRRLAD